MKKYRVIGIMSGTSLDGLDIAYCVFKKKKKWEYYIPHAKTIKYSKKRKEMLSNAFRMKRADLLDLDMEYGKYIGTEVVKFIRKKHISSDLIASHGHTVFHQPKHKITVQIGSGENIASITGLPVVCDFRTGDVALGGQGAPLVPIVDKLLFSKYSFCLNLGGFANISFEKKIKRIAFDICPVNIVLNELANKLGKEFDNGGKIASGGVLHSGLFGKLNKLPYYRIKSPKSLGREWVESRFWPILRSFDIPTKDKMRTVIEHIAIQIAAVVNVSADNRTSLLLITGGGVYNKFLLKRISFHVRCKVVLPDDKTIQFKEAMAFALLGVLKIRKEINILKSVTGAKKDSSGGRVYLPDQNAESSS